MKRRLIKLALIASPLVAFYFWSFLGLAILGIVGIIYLIITYKPSPYTPEKTVENINYFFAMQRKILEKQATNSKKRKLNSAIR